MADFYVGGYWGARRETVEDCAGRLAEFLERLAEIDELLSSWFLKARTKKAANKPVQPDVASLTQLLGKGRNRTDFGGEIIESLGFSASMWNRRPEAADLSCGVGMFSDHVPNVVLVHLPEPEGAGLRLYRPEAAAAVITAVIEIWDPDWATCSSSELRDAQGGATAGRPVIGWATYLRSAPDMELPAATTRHAVGPGQLITIDGEPLATTSDAVVNLANTLRTTGSD